MTSWFRSWHGAPTDPKWLMIAKRAKVPPGIVCAVAWAIYDHASQADDRGDISEFCIETFAAFSEFTEDEINNVMDAFRGPNGIITDNRLKRWEKRQPKREDDSTERVKRHRKKKRGETHGNADKRTVTHTETEQIQKEDSSSDENAVRVSPDDPFLNGTKSIEVSELFTDSEIRVLAFNNNSVDVMGELPGLVPWAKGISPHREEQKRMIRGAIHNQQAEAILIKKTLNSRQTRVEDGFDGTEPATVSPELLESLKRRKNPPEFPDMPKCLKRERA